MVEDEKKRNPREPVDGVPAQMTEAERQALLDECSQTPSPNPFYRGKTPAEVARLLFGGKPPP